MKTSFSFVVPWFGGQMGGAETAIGNYAKNLSCNGFDVEILTTCCKSPFSSWWEDSLPPSETMWNEIPIKRFRVNKSNKDKYLEASAKQISGNPLTEDEMENFFTYGINSDEMIGYIASICNARNVVVAPYFQALSYSVLMKNPGKISFIPCLHNEPQFYWTQTKRMLEQAKHIIFLSAAEKAMAIKHYGLTIGRKLIESPVVGVGVEIENDSSANHLYQLPDKYFVYVGKKDVNKGVGKLIDWYASFDTAIPLVFVGGGDNGLIPKSDKFIDFGFVDEEQKHAIIKNSSALINLSDNESFSIVIMEAWLHGVPIIVSADCDVTRQHCVESGGGFWVNENKTFIEKLQCILNNNEKSIDMGNRGRNYVQQNYNWHKVMASFIRVFYS